MKSLVAALNHVNIYKIDSLQLQRLEKDNFVSLQNPFSSPNELSDQLELKKELVEKIEWSDHLEAFRLGDPGDS